MLQYVANSVCNLDFTDVRYKKLVNLDDCYCSSYQIALKGIIESVLEYKKYLPSSMIGVNDEETNGNEDESSEKYKLNKKNSQNIISNTKDGNCNIDGDVSPGSNYESSRSSVKSGTNNNNKSRKGKKMWKILSKNLLLMKKRKKRNRLNEKRITILIVDIIQFHGHIKSLSHAEFLDLHSDFIECMTNLLKQFGSSEYSFQGDKLIASWNCLKKQVDHNIRACSCAIKMVNNLEKVLYPKWREKQLPLVSIRVSICCGNCIIGYFGSNDFKRFTQIGECVSLVYSLHNLNIENLNRKSNSDQNEKVLVNGNSVILIDENVRKEVAFSFSTQLYEIVNLRKSIKKRKFIRIYLIDPKKSSNELKRTYSSDEWLYSIDEKHLTKDSNDYLEQSWNYLFNSKFDRAKKQLELYKQSDAGDRESNYTILEKRINEKNNVPVIL